MRNSCVLRPADRPLILIHSEDLEFTDNDHCAAALISFFEYWHNIKLRQRQKAIEENDIREAHGDTRSQNESLVQFHTLQQFEDGLLRYYRKDAIRTALRKLVDLKVIEQFRNPNPRYSFDKTSHFLFRPEVLNEWFSTTEDGKPTFDRRKAADRGAENQPPSSENRTRSSVFSTAIQEITSEITNGEEDIYTPPPASPITKAAAGSKTPVERIDRVPKEQAGIWFNEWWDGIWRKEGKSPAWKTFLKHISSEERWQKLQAITSQVAPRMLEKELQYRKTPAAWLNTEPWNDLGETSPPQVAIVARAAVNGGTVARPSRKEETRTEFARLVFEEMQRNG